LTRKLRRVEQALIEFGETLDLDAMVESTLERLDESLTALLPLEDQAARFGPWPEEYGPYDRNKRRRRHRRTVVRALSVLWWRWRP